MPDPRRVGVCQGLPGYDAVAPYSPRQGYPEYPHPDNQVSSENFPYEGVRSALALLGCDADRYGSKGWNPLKEIVKPGDCVVIKPNFVRNFRDSYDDHGDCLITHGAIIRAVIDYVYIALRGSGRIVVADAPQNDADFSEILRIAGLSEVQELYQSRAGFNIEVFDLRRERARKIDGVIIGHEPLCGDPAGYIKINLGEESEFAATDHLSHLLYGTEYDIEEVRRHHNEKVHEYLISGTVLGADVIISLPKLKTHKKVGLTANLKNMVGINGDKNWLPHHREGTPATGGDQFTDDAFMNRVEKGVVSGFKKVFPRAGRLRPMLAIPAKAMGKRVFGDTNQGRIRSGNWYGNDTAWRMVLDLNRILLYADREGQLHSNPQRRFISVVDGIVAGEGNGPLDARPRHFGCVVAGFNPLSVDLVCARMMGFDHRRIPLLRHASQAHPLALMRFSPDDVVCCSNQKSYSGALGLIRAAGPGFEPHFGWRGHIELEGDRKTCVG